MPKADRWSPKGISNHIKSKGLQKLRWFCQMCNKQCRDENGFKCHTTSEGHQRQLLLFAENPHKFLDDYSKEFEQNYLDLLRRRFGTKRVHANVVYQEYISWKEHLHMNSTVWETLSGFVTHLGRSGKCIVDKTEKGWFVTYIDRDALEREAQLAKKQKMDKEDDERMLEFVQKQAEKEREKEIQEGKYNDDAGCSKEFKRENEDEKIKIELKSMMPKDSSAATTLGVDGKPVARVTPFSSMRLKPQHADEHKKPQKTKSGSSSSALDEIREEQEKRKELQNRKDHWLHKDIVVKVISRKHGDENYKKKAVVRELLDDYTAVVKMLDTKEKITVDQSHLETVIPALGKRVLVVNGAYRGCVAVLETLNEEKFCVTIRIDSGPANGRLVENVKYEDICKTKDS